MTRVIEWIISLLIVVALFVAIGVFLPSKRSVSHEVETNRPMSTVNDLLDSFTRFKDWNALINHDPKMQLTVTGPDSGVGARLANAMSGGAIILAGVRIGSRAVIGAGSVVTRDVPEGMFAAGNPCRVIRPLTE